MALKAPLKQLEQILVRANSRWSFFFLSFFLFLTVKKPLQTLLRTIICSIQHTGDVPQCRYLFIFMDYLSVKLSLNLRFDFIATTGKWPWNSFKPRRMHFNDLWKYTGLLAGWWWDFLVVLICTCHRVRLPVAKTVEQRSILLSLCIFFYFLGAHFHDVTIFQQVNLTWNNSFFKEVWHKWMKSADCIAVFSSVMDRS